MSTAARLAELCAATMYLSTSLRRPWVRRRLISSSAPEIPASRLLKSCARPPVSWPTASIFCDWRSCSSACISMAVRSATRCSRVSLSARSWAWASRSDSSARVRSSRSAAWRARMSSRRRSRSDGWCGVFQWVEIMPSKRPSRDSNGVVWAERIPARRKASRSSVSAMSGHCSKSGMIARWPSCNAMVQLL